MLNAIERKIIRLAMKYIATEKYIFSCSAISKAAAEVDSCWHSRVVDKYGEFYDQHTALWGDLRYVGPGNIERQEQLNQRLTMLSLFLETKGEL
jgi:hypothetical protein